MIDDDVDSFLGEIIDADETLQAPAVIELVAHKINRPALVRSLRDQQRLAFDRDALAPPTLLHLQAFLLLESVYALYVHTHSLASQQRIDTSIVEASPFRRQLPEPRPYLLVRCRGTQPAVQYRVRLSEQSVRPPFRNRCLRLRRFAPRMRVYPFPRATSLSASMSGIAAANSFLSFAFSPSSSRSVRASLASFPSNRPRHF